MPINLTTLEAEKLERRIEALERGKPQVIPGTEHLTDEARARVQPLKAEIDRVHRDDGVTSQNAAGDALMMQMLRQRDDEIERLQSALTRAKDALLDGQSTQWIHDLLVSALTGRNTKP